MSNFLRVVKMISAYKGLTALVILFDILSVIFSLFSLTMVVPLLGVLFGIQPLVMEKPAFTLTPNGLIDRFYYEISRVILDGAGQVTLDGQMHALVLICGFVVITFLLKNLFRYLALFFSAPLKNAVVRDIRDRREAQARHWGVNVRQAFLQTYAQAVTASGLWPTAGAFDAMQALLQGFELDQALQDLGCELKRRPAVPAATLAALTAVTDLLDLIDTTHPVITSR